MFRSDEWRMNAAMIRSCRYSRLRWNAPMLVNFAGEECLIGSEVHGARLAGMGSLQ